ncbi:MAG: helix-turn-helix domain-containing protein [Planctomycetota bacterium]
MQAGRKILNLRCDREISQQDLAKACGITPSALSKIEAGINSPRAHVLWRIAKNLGVTVEYLLDEAMPYPYPGYAYRQSFFEKKEDPNATVRVEVTREEKAFLDALRKSSQVARETAMAIPETSVETLRLVHFLINHSKIRNLGRGFLSKFEALVTGGSARAAERSGEKEPAGAKPRKPGRRSGRKEKAEP